jgi:hypothetical protein
LTDLPKHHGGPEAWVSALPGIKHSRLALQKTFRGRVAGPTAEENPPREH